MPLQNPIMNPGPYTDANGVEQYGVDPVLLDAWYAEQQATNNTPPGQGDANINPPGGGSNNSWQDYMDEAGGILSGMQSSTTVEDIRRREQDERERTRQAAESIFGPRLEQSRILGEKQVGSGEAQIGQSRGLGMSSAETSYIASIQKEVDTRINDILQAKAEYISSGNFAAANRADDALEKLETSKNNLILQKADLALKLYSAGRDEAKFNFDVVSNLTEGKTWTDPTSGKTYTGIKKEKIDPFWSGSDIINYMKAIPVGQTETLEDPNTGAVYEVTGLKTDDPTMKTMQATDASGNVTITSYRVTDQGAEIINQVSAGKVGKGSGGGGDDTDKETENFLKGVEDTVSKLASGDWAWGDAYNYMNTVYGRSNPDLTAPLTPEEVEALGGDPSTDQNRLDIFLNKSQFNQ